MIFSLQVTVARCMDPEFSQRGSNFDNFFFSNFDIFFFTFILVDEGVRGTKYHFKGVIIGLLAKLK